MVDLDLQKEEEIKRGSSNMKFCRECGKEVMEKAVICTGCGCETGFKNMSEGSATGGININIQNEANNFGKAGTKNKWVAFFLCLFLGGFGGHKFYEGKVGMGIAYILFSWTFIPSVIAFFEMIGYAMKSETEYTV